MPKESIPTNAPLKSHYADVLGSKMHYVEQGSGHPILFLHEIPTSGYIWRNIIPHLAKLGRCIAPDLIGMGKSDKPNIEYSISDHIKYITQFIEVMNLKRVTIVMHGWGSLIGLSYAMNNEKNCRGLVCYEAFLRPIDADSISLPLQEQITELEQLENINEMILNGAKFIDRILPQSMLKTLSDDELTYYREPFLQDGSGKPLQQYLNELPRGNGKSKVDEVISTYSKKLEKSHLPKLILYSLPGFITTISTLVWAKDHLANIEIAEIGEDLHYAQESNPVVMGETISIWLQGIESVATK